MNEPAYFTKKKVTIEAIRFMAGLDGNFREVQEFVGVLEDGDTYGFRMRRAIDGAELDNELVASVFDVLHNTWVGVKHGQWIIKGVKGEFYPCDDEVFWETYDREENPEPMKLDQQLVIWQDPPGPKESKASRVMRELQSRPNEWALIEEAPSGIVMMPWWNPIYQSDDFETRMVRKGSGLFPRTDIYARYTGG